ncbi:hypothetical protein [Enhygromyxa salina]|uniref:hypothetical protein n=1 Tax=Enhygromyxa salina TaxID=215803 RepID=UPI0030B82AF7
MLTANHVVTGGGDITDGQRIAIETESTFVFGFEAGVCGGPTASGAVGITGAAVVRSSKEKDLLLLRLTTTLPHELGAYFFGWCDLDLWQGVAISHPCGAPKTIAVSEFGEVDHVKVYQKDVYDVAWWEEGALAAGSSGAPLLSESSGTLRGIYTGPVQAGSEACSDPGNVPAQDRFTAMSTILEFLPEKVRGGATCVGTYDDDDYGSLLSTVEDASYYGPGAVVTLTAKHSVWLLDGFFADYGAQVIVVTGAPP